MSNEKKTWLFGVYRGWTTTQLYRDSFVKPLFSDPVIFPNQPGFPMFFFRFFDFFSWLLKVQNIMLKNLTDVCVGTLGWWATGWAFAYGGPMTSDGLLENGFMGFSAKVGEFPGWDRKWEPQKIATYPQTPTLAVGRERWPWWWFFVREFPLTTNIPKLKIQV